MAWFPKHHPYALHALFNYCVLGIIYVLYTVRVIIHQVEARTVAYTCIMNTSIVRHNMHTRRWVVHLTTVPPSSIKGMNMSFRHAMHRCLSPLARCRTMKRPIDHVPCVRWFDADNVHAPTTIPAYNSNRSDPARRLLATPHVASPVSKMETFELQKPRRVPVTTATCAVIVLLFALSAAGAPCESAFSLIVSNTMIAHKRVWNIFTSGLLETNVLSMTLSVAACFTIGGIVESKWSSPQFAMYVFVVQLFCGLLTMSMHILFYILFGAEGYLYQSMHGSWGVLVALLVGLVQCFPESTVPYVPQLKIRYLPVGAVILSTCVRAIVVVELPFVYFSFLGAIMYLKVWRFGNIVGTSPVLGLKFEDFFPPPTNTGARAVASVYFIVRNSVFKKTRARSTSAATPKQVAERRRVKALAMLDVKLAEINATSAGSNETMTNLHSPVSTLAV